MKIVNIHERILDSSPQRVGELINKLASKEDVLWPIHSWPRMKFDRPLGVGAAGGHGPIRYVVEEYSAGESIKFRFTAPKGFDGFHQFQVIEVTDRSAKLEHRIEMRIHGLAVFSWYFIFRPLHDALIEDGLSTAQISLGLTPNHKRWSVWVRFLRWSMSAINLLTGKKRGAENED